MAEEQRELQFDELRPVWLRACRESHDAYAAFEAYRDMPRPRVLVDAFRARTGLAEAGWPSGAWKRWFTRYRWIERAAAYDEWKDGIDAGILAEERRARLRQRLEFDRNTHWPQIIAINRKLDELVMTGLAKTTSVNASSGVTNSLDRAQIFELYFNASQELESKYFGLSEPDADAGAAKEGKAGAVPLVGKFEWIPDPDVPDAVPLEQQMPQQQPPENPDDPGDY